MAKTILVVEDEKPLANALREILTEAGYQVETSFDGIFALDILKRKKFNLVLLDLLMPGLGGYDVLDILQNEHKGCKVVIISNLSREEEIKKAKAKGAADYIVKSDVSLSDIVARVKNILTE